MRLRFSQHHSINAFTCLALATTICGASRPEGKTPRPEPSAMTSSVAQAPSRAVQAPSPSRIQGGFQTRANFVARYPGTHIVVPRPWDRCMMLPDSFYWRTRDLSTEIQWMARRGFIPVSPVGDSVEVLSDYTMQPAGWRAYGISVPAGGTVQVEVKHPNLAWFRLMLVDKWGVPGPGMLQAAIAHQPVMVTYKNPNKDDRAIYVIVDDPAWWSDAKSPYTLEVRRDWDPAKTDLSKVQMVAGLWGASPSVSAEFRHSSLTGPAVYPH
ncbi:hypothetical protein GETHLI_03390 [Geothrix limicola]|uniref:Uncharacterized protein n=2 Tax=Geothrix limicola TaxID=2927978 RepID=A0ABQ5QB19_9BACT|nr:hypothetical protein GETHLI_03390 [Geothrix limicola]